MYLTLRIGNAGDKSIFANPVTLKEYTFEIIRSQLRGTYDLERGSTEVGFEQDFESMKLAIST